MGNVLYLPKHHDRQREVIDFLADLLVRARTGEITGLVCMLAVMGEQNEVSVVGDFAANRAYALHAVKAARELLSND
jgi:hypothetical protein